MNDFAMTIRNLDQRHVALGILAVLVLGLLSITLLPIWLVNATYQSRIDTAHRQLARLEIEASADERLRPKLENLRRMQLRDGHYLKGDTDAVAAAELQKLVKGIASRNGMQLMSTQILPAGRESDFVRVTLRVRMRGTFAGTMASVHAFESNPTFLFLDRLSISHGGGGRGPLTGTTDFFDCDFDLVGYMPARDDDDEIR